MVSQSLLTAAFALFGLVATLAVLLKGWQGWLALKTRELESCAPRPAAGFVEPTSAAARIELADLKERIRLLEAIAAGVDP